MTTDQEAGGGEEVGCQWGGGMLSGAVNMLVKCCGRCSTAQRLLDVGGDAELCWRSDSAIPSEAPGLQRHLGVPAVGTRARPRSTQESQSLPRVLRSACIGCCAELQTSMGSIEGAILVQVIGGPSVFAFRAPVRGKTCCR
jgi:hypothetical protein